MTYSLKNGMVLPALGYGTSEMSTENGEERVKTAIEVGYRLIDTAANYGTERYVGGGIRKAIEAGIVTRDEIVVQTKLANEDQGYYSALRAFDRSLNELGLEYVDVYLMHWPIPKDHQQDYQQLNRDSWLAMEQLIAKGLARTIGVCNFLPRHLRNIMDGCTVPPMIDQLELHPYYQQRDTVAFCREHGLQVQAWGPYRKGAIFRDETVCRMAEEKGVSVPELIYAWDRQIGCIPIMKADSPEHMRANLALTECPCTLTGEDMERLGRLDSPDGHMDFWNYKRQLAY